MMKQHDIDALYPIREVSRLTGVKPITLRAWERRYNLIEPVRTDSGHRLYTQQHIDYLKQALKLVEDGIPISRVKSVILDQSRLREQKNIQQSQQNTLTEQLHNACDQLQYLTLERLLDRLFADHSLVQLFEIANEVEDLLSSQQRPEQSTIARALWHSQLTQRLQARLQMFSTRTIPGTRAIYIHNSTFPNWMAKLISLYCCEQGFQPIHFDQAPQLSQVLEQTKSLQMHGLIWLQSQYDAALLDALQPYSTLRTWILGEQGFEDRTPPTVNTELRDKPNWLLPLNR